MVQGRARGDVASVSQNITPEYESRSSGEPPTQYNIIIYNY